MLTIVIAAGPKKAQNAAKAVLKGVCFYCFPFPQASSMALTHLPQVHSRKNVKARTSTSFHRPKTLVLSRSPKYTRKSIVHEPRLDAHRVVIHPLNTESAMKKMEEHNTLVFIVDVRANKAQIKASLKQLYDIDCVKINTLVRYDAPI